MQNCPYIVRDAIAVLGSATAPTEQEIVAAFEIGRELSRHNVLVLTGATTGVPYAAALGAKEAGGTVVGISPAEGYLDHVQRFSKPVDAIDFLLFTGMGYEGRNPLIVRSALGAIFVGGEFGTINEFSAAWTCGTHVLGILRGVGRIADLLESASTRARTNYGSNVIVDSDPRRLAARVAVEGRSSRPGSSLLEQAQAVGSEVRDIIKRHISRQQKMLGAHTL